MTKVVTLSGGHLVEQDLAVSGAAIYTVTVDVGDVPRRSVRFDGVTVAGLSAGANVVASVAPHSSRSFDEIEMDPVMVSVRVTAAAEVSIVVASASPITGQWTISLAAA